ncbi:MAG TPA: hypothetical protein VFS09_13250 [Candidatus Eisenbacteria bacterium]|nr:hypothetical protein [Candidatus Eisenbacteria bacterium]
MRVAVRTLVAVIVAFAASSVPESARAQSEPPSGRVPARQVGEHRFAGAVGVPNPFLSTYVSSSTGMATTLGLKVGLFNLDDPPQLLGTKEIDLYYLSQSFLFQQRVADAVALRLAVFGSGRLGTETASLLTEGISAIMGGSAGGTVRLTERPGFKLAATLDAGLNSLSAVSLRSFVEDIVANGLSDSTNSPTQQLSNFRLTTGLRAAWGRSVTTGYLLYGDIGYDEPYEQGGGDEFYWQAGGAVSLDMRERWGPDVGFTLGAAVRSDLRRNEDLGNGGWSTSLGVFYSGRPELTLGCQMLYTQLQQSKIDDTFGALGFAFILGYDFR